MRLFTTPVCDLRLKDPLIVDKGSSPPPSPSFPLTFQFKNRPDIGIKPLLERHSIVFPLPCIPIVGRELYSVYEYDADKLHKARLCERRTFFPLRVGTTEATVERKRSRRKCAR